MVPTITRRLTESLNPRNIKRDRQTLDRETWRLIDRETEVPDDSFTKKRDRVKRQREIDTQRGRQTERETECKKYMKEMQIETTKRKTKRKRKRHTE